MKQHMNLQKGFTLIEIAIVLVIIGLMSAAILKGSELIESGKAKNAVNEINGITAAYNGYIDRYKRKPGDDGPLATLTARGGDWATVTLAGNNDRIITSTAAQTFTGAGENAGFWQHLRASGLISGDMSLVGINALPINAFGGLTGITSDNVMPAAANGLRGTKLCISQAPGKQAAALDTQLDDGNPNTGSVRATLGVAGQNTAPGAIVAGAVYNEGEIYTVCKVL